MINGVTYAILLTLMFRGWFPELFEGVTLLKLRNYYLNRIKLNSGEKKRKKKENATSTRRFL